MSVDGLINKDNIIYTVKYYLAMKKDCCFFFPNLGHHGMNLENVTLYEINQTQKEKYSVISLSVKSEKFKLYS